MPVTRPPGATPPRAWQPLTDYDEALKEAGDLLEAARIQIGEAAHAAVGATASGWILDPQRLAELESRIEAVTSLRASIASSAEELPRVLVRLERALATN